MKRRLKDVRREAREYLKRYPDATPDEIDALYEWMRDGNSPYENGDYVWSPFKIFCKREADCDIIDKSQEVDSWAERETTG